MTHFLFFFFYNDTGDGMKVYVDLLLLFNFLIDLLLLLSVASILKRKVNFYRVVSGAFLGSFSVFCLFLPISNLSLLGVKLLFSVGMILLTFPYQNFRYLLKNLGYFYFASITLGGIIYLWNTTFSFGGVKTSFISNSYQLNFLGMLFLAPIAIAYYVRKMKTMQENYHFYQKVWMVVGKQSVSGVGYIDSGNSLMYKRKPVILASKNLVLPPSSLYIPYQTASGVGLLPCYPIRELTIEGRSWKNLYLGIMDRNITMDGVDFLLHKTMIGECYD